MLLAAAATYVLVVANVADLLLGGDAFKVELISSHFAEASPEGDDSATR